MQLSGFHLWHRISFTQFISRAQNFCNISSSHMKLQQKCLDFWSHLKIATKVCYFCSKLCLCAKILSTLLAKIPTCLPLQVTFNCPKTTTSHPLSTLQLCLFKCKLAIYLWVGWYHNDYKTSLCSQLNLN